jgi:hypothetical protein
LEKSKHEEEARLAAEAVKATATKDCSVCHKEQLKELFTSKMWRAKEGRVCKVCSDEIARQEEEKKRKEEEEEAARKGAKRQIVSFFSCLFFLALQFVGSSIGGSCSIEEGKG